MANMFSGNVEKIVPGDLKSCYRTDPVAENLWVWCERLEKWGKILFWILIVVGVIITVGETISAAESVQSETAPLVFVSSFLSWALYAVIEYCAYHIVALLLGSLANIVQHTKITANVALYNAAMAEGFNCDSKEMNKEINNPVTNYVFCKKCGAENIASQIICQNCGESLKPVKQPIVHKASADKGKSKKCVCGERYYGDVCPSCGRKN